MKTLEQHNNTRSQSADNLAGVKCDKCGTEMFYPEPDMVMASHPPQKKVKCAGCGETGNKVCGPRLRRDQRGLNDRSDEFNGQGTIDNYMARHGK